ncbi:hypothetical protein GUJ93_ZPchr0009g452 [Zizania palustris]|uniref:Uncharacterized protein n=1 Tax=Zizania palustris TaxID=103762 RepID=A0A8J5RJX3_ZIZPA|nr:hypothetical protein GUJ93_ZPchr0009g452 [Zizania palustris]
MMMTSLLHWTFKIGKIGNPSLHHLDFQGQTPAACDPSYGDSLQPHSGTPAQPPGLPSPRLPSSLFSPAIILARRSSSPSPPFHKHLRALPLPPSRRFRASVHM